MSNYQLNNKNNLHLLGIQVGIQILFFLLLQQSFYNFECNLIEKKKIITERMISFGHLVLTWSKRVGGSEEKEYKMNSKD